MFVEEVDNSLIEGDDGGAAAVAVLHAGPAEPRPLALRHSVVAVPTQHHYKIPSLSRLDAYAWKVD